MNLSVGIQRAQDSRYGQSAAVVGLASRAIIYGGLTALVVQLAAGARRGSTDQGSALASLGTVPAGSVLLVAVIVGVACYVLWRWSVAWLGARSGADGTSDGNDKTQRVMAFLEGIGYLPMAYLAASVLFGDSNRANQGKQYRSLSAQVLQSGAGRLLVGVVGGAVIVIGGFFCYQGARRTFAKQFDFPHHQPWVRPIVLALGTVGSIARGLIFAEAGVLVIYAAVTIDPRAAGGLDAALDALRRQPYGAVLLYVAAAGFAAFALFAVAEAAWRER